MGSVGAPPLSDGGDADNTRLHMFSATDPRVPRRSCVWCCRTTSVERFADQPPSASPLPWTVPTALKRIYLTVSAWPSDFLFLGADYK